jgi:hypothetical protein
MADSIVPIQPYTVNQATQIKLSLDYIFEAIDCTIIVIFMDGSGNQLGTTSVFVPEDVYSTWSADEPIIEYVLTTLGLTAA